MPSVNDNFADAIEVTIATAGGTYTSALISNVANTVETNEPVGTEARSMWFKYTPTSSGTASFDTQLSTPIATSTDTYMTVFTGTALINLVSVATDDDGGGSGTSLISGLAVTAGTTYWVQVGGYGNTELNVRLRATGPETTGGGGTAYDKTPADAAAVTDARAAVQASVRTTADGVGVSDARTVTRSTARTPADPLGITDAATISRATSRTHGDPVGLTDSVTAEFTGSVTRTPADPVAMTDAVTVVVNASRTPADTVAATDTDNPLALGYGETIPDPVGLTDSVTAVMSRVHTVADFLALTDTATASGSGANAANPTDPVGVTDTRLIELARPRTVGDSTAVGDAAAVAFDRPRAVADAAGVSDSVVAVLERVVTVTDSVSVADAAAGYAGLILSGRILGNRVSSPTARGTLRTPTAQGRLR